MIHENSSSGNETWYEYDKYGNVLTHINKKKDGSTFVYVYKLDYHKDGKTKKKIPVIGMKGDKLWVK